jgi:hypothetical protein
MISLVVMALESMMFRVRQNARIHAPCLAVVILLLSLLPGCRDTDQTRDMAEGVDESDKATIVDFLSKAGVTNPVFDIVQDRGDHWYASLSSYDQMPSASRKDATQKNKKRVDPGTVEKAPPEFKIYKTGRVVLPPGMQPPSKQP